jgi:hypothetical protein
VLALAAGLARADDYISPTEERVRLSLGIMQTKAKTTLRVDTDAGAPGTVVDGEGELGLDNSRIEPKFQAMVRVGEDNRLRFDYFTLDRSDQKTLATAQPIEFGNVTLQPGYPVQTDLNLELIGITYGYSFVHRQNLEIAGTLGVNIVDISARARVQTQTLNLDQSEDLAGPYPALGIDATWVLSRRFYLDGRAQYLRVSVSDLNGSLGVYELDALYRFRPNVSFALGYDLVRVRLASSQSNQSGQFEFDGRGPELFVRVAF